MRPKLKMTVTMLLAMGVQALPGWAAAGHNTLQRCLSLRAEQENFSGVITVINHGRAEALISRGNLNDTASPLINLNTRFNLASMGKMFTAVAVAQLAEARQLQLDAAIGRYVPGLTPETSIVTVRQLLDHSAGLGNFFQPQNAQAILAARSASDLMPLIASDRPAFTPGSRFEYSNNGFALLGILVEKVSGMRYGDYLQRHVFGPAGMKDTGLDPKPLDTLAIAMTAGPGALRANGPGSDNPLTSTKPTLTRALGAAEAYGSPAGGVFSTSQDLQRFAAVLAKDGLTSAAMTAALTSKQIVVAPASRDHPERDYGLGFGIGSAEGHRWYGHNGGTLGANTEFAVFPDDHLVLTVLSNRDPPAATRLFSYARGLALNPVARSSCGESNSSAASAPDASHASTIQRLIGIQPPDHVLGSMADVAMDVRSGMPSISMMVEGQLSTVGLDTGAPPGLHLVPEMAARFHAEARGSVDVQIGAITVQGWLADDGGRLNFPEKA